MTSSPHEGPYADRKARIGAAGTPGGYGPRVLLADSSEVDRVPGADGTASLYGLALAGAPVAIRLGDGSLRPLDVSRWLGRARGADLGMLDRACGPVLDVGCGPGRLLVALRRRRVPALGIDVAPEAVRMTRQAGAAALSRCVFEPLPSSGRWQTVLLADGNIGIGGDPQRLLQRVRELLLPGGQVVIEVEAPGGGVRCTSVRLESALRTGRWFSWSRVPDDEVATLCAAAGLLLSERWQEVEEHCCRPRTRWFATASRPVQDL